MGSPKSNIIETILAELRNLQAQLRQERNLEIGIALQGNYQKAVDELERLGYDKRAINSYRQFLWNESRILRWRQQDPQKFLKITYVDADGVLKEGLYRVNADDWKSCFNEVQERIVKSDGSIDDLLLKSD